MEDAKDWKSASQHANGGISMFLMRPPMNLFFSDHCCHHVSSRDMTLCDFDISGLKKRFAHSIVWAYRGCYGHTRAPRAPRALPPASDLERPASFNANLKRYQSSQPLRPCATSAFFKEKGYAVLQCRFKDTRGNFLLPGSLHEG